MSNTEKRSKLKTYTLLHALLLFYSAGGICSKYAANQELFSFKFFLFYGLLLFTLFIYAIFWQQVLKDLPVSVAYSNKAITVIWGMMWGALVFGEHITLFNIIGALIIIAGILIVVYADHHQE